MIINKDMLAAAAHALEKAVPDDGKVYGDVTVRDVAASVLTAAALVATPNWLPFDPEKPPEGLPPYCTVVCRASPVPVRSLRVYPTAAELDQRSLEGALNMLRIGVPGVALVVGPDHLGFEFRRVRRNLPPDMAVAFIGSGWWNWGRDETPGFLAVSPTGEAVYSTLRI